MTFADSDKESAQLKRRLFGEDEIRVPVPLGPDDDLAVLLKALARCSLVPIRCDWSAQNMEIVYTLTAGIDDFVVTLWAEVQRLASVEKELEVTPTLLRRAAEQSSRLRKFESMIKGFVLRQDELLTGYIDIDVTYYKRAWLSAESSYSPPPPAAPEAADVVNCAPAAVQPASGTTYTLASGGGPKEAAKRLSAPIKAEIAKRQDKNAQDDALIEKLKAHHAQDLRALISEQ